MTAKSTYVGEELVTVLVVVVVDVTVAFMTRH